MIQGAMRGDHAFLRQEECVWKRRAEMTMLGLTKNEIKTHAAGILKSGDLFESNGMGMTPEEVASLIGKPRAKSNGHLNYGRVWVVVRHDLVDCIVIAEAFFYAGDRSYYKKIKPSDIIK
jgi:hypothetical protein